MVGLSEAAVASARHAFEVHQALRSYLVYSGHVLNTQRDFNHESFIRLIGDLLNQSTQIEKERDKWHRAVLITSASR